MRKILVLILVLVNGMFINVYAESSDSLIDIENGSDSVSRVIYVSGVEVPVYSVDVTWGKMEFVYTEQVNYIWNNNTHEYSLGESTYDWVSEDNYVEVNNKSFTSINVDLEYVGLKSGVNGSFNVSNKEITSNSNSRFILTLNGKLDSSNLDYIKVGTINLKIS